MENLEREIQISRAVSRNGYAGDEENVLIEQVGQWNSNNLNSILFKVVILSH